MIKHIVMCGVLQYVQDDGNHRAVCVVFSTLGVGNKVTETDANEFRTRRKSIKELKNLIRAVVKTLRTVV